MRIQQQQQQKKICHPHENKTVENAAENETHRQCERRKQVNKIQLTEREKKDEEEEE